MIHSNIMELHCDIGISAFDFYFHTLSQSNPNTHWKKTLSCFYRNNCSLNVNKALKIIQSNIETCSSLCTCVRASVCVCTVLSLQQHPEVNKATRKRWSDWRQAERTSTFYIIAVLARQYLQSGHKVFVHVFSPLQCCAFV